MVTLASLITFFSILIILIFVGLHKPSAFAIRYSLQIDEYQNKHEFENL